MVEFALVVPILLLVLLGIMDFGRALNYWITETHLANQGARFAVVDRWPTKGTETLTAYLESKLTTKELRDGSSKVTPAAFCVAQLTGSTGTTGNVGDPIEVRVETEYEWIVSEFFDFFGVDLVLPTITLAGTATMRLEAKNLDGDYGTACA